MTKLPYTSEEMQGKYIAYSPILLKSCPVMACVVHHAGPLAPHPLLFNSIHDAESDYYFDPLWDEVIPASEYFEMLSKQEKSVIKP